MLIGVVAGVTFRVSSPIDMCPVTLHQILYQDRYITEPKERSCWDKSWDLFYYTEYK